jgi:hypothetical protein
MAHLEARDEPPDCFEICREWSKCVFHGVDETDLRWYGPDKVDG